MLRIIGTLIGTAMVQFRVPSDRERERGGEGEEGGTHRGELNYQVRVPNPGRIVPSCSRTSDTCLCESERERENAAERRGESTLFNGSALSKPSLRNALFLGIKFFVIPPPPPSVTGRSIGDVPIQ